MKPLSIKAYSFLAVFNIIILLLLSPQSYSQGNCISGCNDNTYLNATDPNTLEYDNIVSTYHSTILKEAGGKVLIWGEYTGADGESSLLRPVEIKPGSGIEDFNYDGHILRFTGGSSKSRPQLAILTTEGLYIWGKGVGYLVHQDVKSTTAFEKMGSFSTGTNSYGLPNGVTPGDVKMLFGSYGTLCIVTCDGKVWILSMVGNKDGETADSKSIWRQIYKSTNDAGTIKEAALTDVVAARGVPSGMMALTSDGEIYTWGTGTYLGNGTIAASRRYATKMTLPTGVNTTTNRVKMIGMTIGAYDKSSNSKNSYFLLTTTGQLWSLGYNADKQLGNFSTTETFSWGRVKGEDGNNLTNIVWFSPQEHDRNTGAVNALTADGKLTGWGFNGDNMLGVDNGEIDGVIDPTYMAGGLDADNDKLIALETGGHTTIVIKECTMKFGYVGHRIRGSMADGYNSSAPEDKFNFTETAIVNTCGATTAPIVKDLTTCPGYSVDLENALIDPDRTMSDVEWWTTPDKQPGTQISNTGKVYVGTYYVFDRPEYTDGCSLTYSTVNVIGEASLCPNSTYAVNDENSTWMETPVSGNVIINDFDLEGNMKYLTSYMNQSYVPISPGSYVDGIDANGNTFAMAGQLAFNFDGIYTFTPSPGFSGNVSIPYSVCDDYINSKCDTAYLEITVSPLPLDGNSLIANNDEYYSYGNEVKANILSNDADPQREILSVTSFLYDSDGDGVPDAAGTLNSVIQVGGISMDGGAVLNAGTIKIQSDGSLEFTPLFGFSGFVNLDYTVTDAGTPAATDRAAIAITVLPVKSATDLVRPFAGDDFSYSSVNVVVTGNFSDNDTIPNGGNISMPDITFDHIPIIPGNPAVLIKQEPTKKGGVVQFYSDGTYQYTPPPDYYGSDLVEYQICNVPDGSGIITCTKGIVHFLIRPDIKIKGTVFDDWNGKIDNLVNGTGTNVGNSLYAVLTDDTGEVIQSVAVAADGTYTFNDVPEGVELYVLLADESKTAGTTYTTAVLPDGWVSTGEKIGAGTGHDGTINSKTNALGPLYNDLYMVNFGIDQTPHTENIYYQFINVPTGELEYKLNGTINELPLMAGTDPEDGIYTGKTGEHHNPIGVLITSLPTAGELYYSGYKLTIFDITNETIFADPSKFILKLDEPDYSNLAVFFHYLYLDAAMEPSQDTGIYHIIWGNALPNQLFELTAKQNQHSVDLIWKTTQTNQTTGYYVERSSDGVGWASIGYIQVRPGAAHNTVEEYKFTDYSPGNGFNYYRIQLQDKTGALKYSKIVSVNSSISAELKVYPNPANQYIHINGLSGKETIIIYDVSGRLLHKQQATGPAEIITIWHLKKGVYHISIKAPDGSVKTQQIIKDDGHNLN